MILASISLAITIVLWISTLIMFYGWLFKKPFIMKATFGFEFFIMSLYVISISAFIVMIPMAIVQPEQITAVLHALLFIYAIYSVLLGGCLLGNKISEFRRGL